MSLRFIHTADIHLGAKFGFLGKKGKDMRNKIEETFSSLIDAAINERVDAFLIAGDLFDSNHPSAYLVSFARTEIDRLADAGTKVIIIPGTHDRLGDDGIYSRKDFIKREGVYIFDDPDTREIYIPEIDCAFYANPNIYNKSPKSPLSDFNKSKSAKYHIALAHGSFQIPGKSSEDDYPITEKDILNANMNYIALGHWHKMVSVGNDDHKAYYCGSPELTSFDTEEHGVAIMVSINNANCDVDTIKTGSIYARKLIFEEENATLETLMKTLKSNADKNLILSVAVNSAEIDTDSIDELQEKFSPQFFYLKIELGSEIDDPHMMISGNESMIEKEFMKAVLESEITPEIKSAVIREGRRYLRN